MLLTFLILFGGMANVRSWDSPWTWTCDPEKGRCLKELDEPDTASMSLSKCKLICGHGSLLWPLPSPILIRKTTSTFNPGNINLQVEATDEVKRMVNATVEWQKDLMNSSWPQGAGMSEMSGLEGAINLNVTVNQDTTILSMSVPESYSLKVKNVSGAIEIEIKAETFFGARHGIETLFQLVEWDDLDKTFIMLDDVAIQDSPVFPHRGVLIDTSRNFISTQKLTQIIDSMSFSKLNVLHWHIADTQSFPLHLDALPDLARFGAYSEEMVYSNEDVNQIMAYAKIRGVMILPEFDAPAHVGAGWQSQNENFTVCVDWEPWYEMCVQPGCGQLNPAVDGMYDVLEKIHSEYLRLFQPSVLHMGGDEVNFNCWNSSDSIVDWLKQQGKGREEVDFMFLWEHYQTESYNRVKSASTSLNLPMPSLVLWTSHLTNPEYIKYLDPAIYTIQLWTDSTEEDNPTIKLLAERGFKTIFSNSDALYLDCGFSAWIGEGNNWCSPYKGWQKIYENDPYEMLKMRNVTNLEAAMANVQGGEVALWSEQTDDMSIMTKLEPRMSAHGERMWSNPDSGFYEAEGRMVHHRERLRRRGIQADALQPRWCHQNEKQCFAETREPETTTPAPGPTSSAGPTSSTGSTSSENCKIAGGQICLFVVSFVLMLLFHKNY